MILISPTVFPVAKPEEAKYSRDLLHLNQAGYAALNQSLEQWLKEHDF